MGKTKRKYNKKGNRTGFYHPHQQVCMGRCPRCRDAKNKDADVRRKRLKAKVSKEVEVEASEFASPHAFDI